jgi:hypothetical protein
MKSELHTSLIQTECAKSFPNLPYRSKKNKKAVIYAGKKLYEIKKRLNS